MGIFVVRRRLIRHAGCGMLGRASVWLFWGGIVMKCWISISMPLEPVWLQEVVIKHAVCITCLRLHALVYSKVMRARSQRWSSILKETRSYLQVLTKSLVYGMFRQASASRFFKATRTKSFHVCSTTKVILSLQDQRTTLVRFGVTHKYTRRRSDLVY